MIEILAINNSVELDVVQNQISVDHHSGEKTVNFNKNEVTLEVSTNEININLDGKIIMNQLKFEWIDPPVMRNFPGIPGQMSFDNDYVYICYATDSWGRWIITKGW